MTEDNSADTSGVAQSPGSRNPTSEAKLKAYQQREEATQRQLEEALK